MHIRTVATVALPLSADLTILDDGTVVVSAAYIKGPLPGDIGVTVSILPLDVREAITRHLVAEARSLARDLASADAQLAFPSDAGFGPASSH